MKLEYFNDPYSEKGIYIDIESIVAIDCYRVVDNSGNKSECSVIHTLGGHKFTVLEPPEEVIDIIG